MHPAGGTDKCCSKERDKRQKVGTNIAANASDDQTRASFSQANASLKNNPTTILLQGSAHMMASAGTLRPTSETFFGNVPGPSHESATALRRPDGFPQPQTYQPTHGFNVQVLNSPLTKKILYQSKAATALYRPNVSPQPHTHQRAHEYNVQLLNSPMTKKISRKRSLTSSTDSSSPFPECNVTHNKLESGKSSREEDPLLDDQIAPLYFGESSRSQGSINSNYRDRDTADWVFDWNRAAEFLSKSNDNLHDTRRPHHHEDDSNIRSDDLEPRPLPLMQHKSMSTTIASEQEAEHDDDFEPKSFQQFHQKIFRMQQHDFHYEPKHIFDDPSLSFGIQENEHDASDFEPDPVLAPLQPVIVSTQQNNGLMAVSHRGDGENESESEEGQVKEVAAPNHEEEAKNVASAPSVNLQEQYARHVEILLRSHRSTDEIQERDRQVGLRACHSKTMMESEKTRCELLKLFGIVIKKRRRRRRRRNTNSKPAAQSTMQTPSKPSGQDTDSEDEGEGESPKPPMPATGCNADSARAA